MKKKALKPLRAGQHWRIGDQQIEIVQIGKVLVQFKHFKLKKQRGVAVQMMNIASVQDFLRRNDAKLMKTVVE